MHPITVLKKTKKIHIAITAVFAVFLAVMFFLVNDMPESKEQVDENLFNTFKFGAIVFGVVGIAAGYFIGKSMLKKIPEGTDLGTKVSKYYTVNIIRLALVEAAGFFAGLGYYMTQKRNMIMIAALFLLYMALEFPTLKKIQKEMRLSDEEMNQLKQQK